MSKLTPFRALRPAADLAPRVSSVPYDVVSTDDGDRHHLFIWKAPLTAAQP